MTRNFLVGYQKADLEVVESNLESIINSDLDKYVIKQGHLLDPIIFKLSLPKRLCKSLVEKLIKEGIHFASLKPSYSAVLDQIKLENNLKTERM